MPNVPRPGNNMILHTVLTEIISERNGVASYKSSLS